MYEIRDAPVIIVGGGRFGTRAAGILSKNPGLSIRLIDKENVDLDAPLKATIEQIQRDGIEYLVEIYSLLAPDTLIVPALPIHLAASWILNMPLQGLSLRTVEIPSGVHKSFTNWWPGDFGTLLVSHADFLCPDDCPEPEDGCTVTGEIRPPLHEVLREIDIKGFRTHVIQSRQLAPGLGGYEVRELKYLMDNIMGHGSSKWLIGTSCRCHGVLTAIWISN
jgi:hypothetical protein